MVVATSLELACPLIALRGWILSGRVGTYREVEAYKKRRTSSSDSPAPIHSFPIARMSFMRNNGESFKFDKKTTRFPLPSVGTETPTEGNPGFSNQSLELLGIPLVTTVAMAAAMDDREQYPLLTRLNGSYKALANFVLAIAQLRGWNRLGFYCSTAGEAPTFGEVAPLRFCELVLGPDLV